MSRGNLGVRTADDICKFCKAERRDCPSDGACCAICYKRKINRFDWHMPPKVGATSENRSG